MKVVNIPEKMQKFYGTGTMLHPDQEMVKELVKEIPSGKVATVDSLCARLAGLHETDVACPMRTTNFVKAITEANADINTNIPFWRVIRKNYMLINSPNTLLCAERLKQEGFEVVQTSKGDFRVENMEGMLFTFSK